MRIATMTVAVSTTIRTANTTVRSGDRFDVSRRLVMRQALLASEAPGGRWWFRRGS